MGSRIPLRQRQPIVAVSLVAFAKLPKRRAYMARRISTRRISTIVDATFARLLKPVGKWIFIAQQKPLRRRPFVPKITIRLPRRQMAAILWRTPYTS